MLHIASSEEKIDPIRKTEVPHTAVQVTSEVNHGRHQRPSLIEFLTGDLASNKSQSSAPPSQADSQGQNPQEQQRGILFLDYYVSNVTIDWFCIDCIYVYVCYLFVTESLSSASVASTINQGHASTSDCGQENGANGSSTPCNVPTGMSDSKSE